MKHAATYSIAGGVLLGLTLYFGGWTYLLLWPSVACLLVGVAYAGLDARVFGKRPNGSLPVWSWVLLLPYLAFTWGLWKLKRKISREPFYNEIAPGLWVGRRVLGDELPEGVRVIADVTCEFAEPSSALARCDYRSLPTLNYSVPDKAAFLALVEELAQRDGVYIHCAQGHGRSATLAAAILMRRGLADTSAKAVAMVTRVRPKVHLEPCQREFLNIVVAPLSEE